MTVLTPLYDTVQDISSLEKEDLVGLRNMYLVVVDDSNEMEAALGYACIQARASFGRVALLITKPVSHFAYFSKVGRVLDEAHRRQLEDRLTGVVGKIRTFGFKGVPRVFTTNKVPLDAVVELTGKVPSICALVLAASPNGKTAGPIISALCRGGMTRLSLPVHVVPGHLTYEQLCVFTAPPSPQDDRNPSTPDTTFAQSLF